MEKKTAWIILGVLVIAGAAYMAFMYKAPVAETPTGTAAQGKLDMNVVCQSALAYTTFPDAASAEVFVQECKEGKHPEVVERYKADMHYGDGAQI